MAHGVPEVGDVIDFMDSDRHENLTGIVRLKRWQDLDGEIYCHVITRPVEAEDQFE